MSEAEKLRSAANYAAKGLRDLAFNGNMAALRSLIDLAVSATEAIHELWDRDGGPVNAFSVEAFPSTRARREMLRLIREWDLQRFPTLLEVRLPVGQQIEWDDSEKELRKQRIRKRDRRLPAAWIESLRQFEERQQRIAAAINPAVPAGRGRDGLIRLYLVRHLLELAESIRDGSVPDLHGIRDLPTLAPASCPKWAKAFRDLIWEKKSQDIRKRRGFWRELAEGWKKIRDRRKKEFHASTSAQRKRLRRAGEYGRADTRKGARKETWKQQAQRVADEARMKAIYNNLLDALNSISGGP